MAQGVRHCLWFTRTQSGAGPPAFCLSRGQGWPCRSEEEAAGPRELTAWGETEACTNPGQGEEPLAPQPTQGGGAGTVQGDVGAETPEGYVPLHPSSPSTHRHVLRPLPLCVGWLFLGLQRRGLGARQHPCTHDPWGYAGRRLRRRLGRWGQRRALTGPAAGAWASALGADLSPVSTGGRLL